MGLCIKRKVDESVMIGEDIEIMVIAAGPGWVKLNVRAPRNVPVHRLEIWSRIQEEKEASQ